MARTVNVSVEGCRGWNLQTWAFQEEQRGKFIDVVKEGMKLVGLEERVGDWLLPPWWETVQWGRSRRRWSTGH